ncbi:MAG: UDP-glucose 4-epimerase GalE [Coriobacteriales bacterium]|nr:UDP-glucose 4-epimerase GalE [Coriobacteriales bacterium]
MKVLVIGGAGYIGSHAVYELIRAGHEVVVIDNLSTGLKDFVHPKAKFYWGDIRRKRDLTSVMQAEAPIDVVMHFAAKLIVPESMTQPLQYYENNVEGVRTMLEAMMDCGIKNVVFSSTAAVYGKPENGICNEQTPCSPINPYGETKLASEKLIKWVAAAHGLNYCIFRYFNVAGADESLEIGLKKDQLTHLIPIVMQAVLGVRDKVVVFGDDYDTPDGTCVRDYIHVSDLARAHVLGAAHLVETGESLLCNLGSNNGFSVKEVIEATERIAPVPWVMGPRREGDPDFLVAENALAKKILGWEPQKSLDDILRSDYAYRVKLLEEAGVR